MSEPWPYDADGHPEIRTRVERCPGSGHPSVRGFHRPVGPDGPQRNPEGFLRCMVCNTATYVGTIPTIVGEHDRVVRIEPPTQDGYWASANGGNAMTTDTKAYPDPNQDPWRDQKATCGGCGGTISRSVNIIYPEQGRGWHHDLAHGCHELCGEEIPESEERVYYLMKHCDGSGQPFVRDAWCLPRCPECSGKFWGARNDDPPITPDHFDSEECELGHSIFEDGSCHMRSYHGDDDD